MSTPPSSASAPPPSTPSPLAVPEAWNLVVDGYTSDVVPTFEPYAEAAMQLTGLPRGARVLDVAAGPGTLALLAAKRAAKVWAIDFAAAMIDRLRARAARAGLFNLDARVGDGQFLPYADASFDRAYSMFGLMFFPDRHRGFSELLRVLRPGGRVAVSSWYPVASVPQLAALFEALREALPGLPFGAGRASLSEADEVWREMTRAGFQNVSVHRVVNERVMRSMTEFFASMVRGSAPLVLLRKKVGEPAFAELSGKVEALLTARFGDGPQTVRWPAHVGIGRR